MTAIEIETAPGPEVSVIWLHGLGADGSDFVPIVGELGLADTPAVRFVFPHAPMIPVTCNGGYVMRAWYDILDVDGLGRRVDVDGIRASVARVGALIRREGERGVPPSRVILAGFSQGGAIAYTAGLTGAEPLAGIVALSAYLPAPELLAGGIPAANLKIPIFAAHGSDDDIVPVALGERAVDTLRAAGARIDWHTYPMPHSVCAEEIDALGGWLRARLGAAG